MASEYFRVILGANDPLGRGFEIVSSMSDLEPLSVRLLGQPWHWFFAGECKRVEEYQTTGEPILGGNSSSAQVDLGRRLQARNSFAFLRDRAEEFHSRQPEQAIYRCVEEGILSLFEVFDDGAFDFALVRPGLAIAFSHFLPLHVTLAQNHGNGSVTHIVCSEEPPHEISNLDSSTTRWHTYRREGRARGKLIAATAGTLVFEEPVW